MSRALVLSAVLAVACMPAPPPPDVRSEEAGQVTPSGDDAVARGEYLSHVAGCHDCHTPGAFSGQPDFARALSGSEYGWSGPWGVSYPRNLTPHPETGIGKWTEDDIVRAIRTGVRPDGSKLLPPMPWPQLAHLTDADAHAIARYLKSLPPVEHRAPDALPPGQQATGAVITVPPPPAWDRQQGT